MQIWSWDDLSLQHTYTEHQAPVRAVATSPVLRDHRIVSGDADGLVHLWTVSDTTFEPYH